MLTVLILDDTGVFAVAEGGVMNPLLNEDSTVEQLGTGHNCTELVAPDSLLATQLPDPLLQYFGVVLYWFLEGQPAPLMDIDLNGIPCETKYPREVVESVWAGGWFIAELN